MVSFCKFWVRLCANFGCVFVQILGVFVQIWGVPCANFGCVFVQFLILNVPRETTQCVSLENELQLAHYDTIRLCRCRCLLLCRLLYALL